MQAEHIKRQSVSQHKYDSPFTFPFQAPHSEAQSMSSADSVNTPC